MKAIISIFTFLILATNANAQVIRLDSTEPLSPYVFGFNLEHTRAAVNNGLSAQMLRNRKFAGKPSRNEGLFSPWFRIGEKVYMGEDESYTKHICLEKMRRTNELHSQTVENIIDGQLVGIGQRDIFIDKGKTYQLRTVTKVSIPVKLNVELTNRNGDKVYASYCLELKPDSVWETNEFEMTSTARDSDACIRYTYRERAKVTFGALSMMPKDNFHGMRSDVVANLKAIGPRLLRWPGGNFAGEYRWKDGLLPADQRGPLYAYDAMETQPYTNGFDFHEINTDDFIALCREVGAEPFLTINLVWSTPEESAQWVEYCNGSADSEYGKIRAQNGHPEPYNVKFWSLGNEMGYSHMEGPLKPADYAKLAEPHAEAMLKVTPDLNLFSSGPYPNEDWTKESAAALFDKVKFVSQHDYTWDTYDYTTDEGIRKTYNIIANNTFLFKRKAEMMRDILNRNGLHDLHISFDEWNEWYSWYRPSCVGEGIFALRTLHMYMTESNRLNMPVVCYFQPIGEGAIVITPESSRLTANGQMFAIAKEHQDGRMCKIDNNEDYSTFATIKSDTLTVTLLNYEYDKERVFNFALKGSILSSELYTSDDVTPYSYFTETTLPIVQTKKNVTITLPAHSAAIFKMKIRK